MGLVLCTIQNVGVWLIMIKMGVFSTYNSIKQGNQKISENYLRKMGFKKYKNWGSPSRWGEGSVFWEKIVTIEDDCTQIHHSATVWYFPHTFTGYVTDFGIKGIDPANRVMCMLVNSSLGDYSGSALCKNDIQFAVDLTIQNLKKYWGYI